jgi:ribosomal protein L28
MANIKVCDLCGRQMSSPAYSYERLHCGYHYYTLNLAETTLAGTPKESKHSLDICSGCMRSIVARAKRKKAFDKFFNDYNDVDQSAYTGPLPPEDDD